MVKILKQNEVLASNAGNVVIKNNMGNEFGISFPEISKFITKSLDEKNNPYKYTKDNDSFGDFLYISSIEFRRETVNYGTLVDYLFDNCNVNAYEISEEYDPFSNNEEEINSLYKDAYGLDETKTLVLEIQ